MGIWPDPRSMAHWRVACAGLLACVALLAPVRRRAYPSPPQSRRQNFVHVKGLVSVQHAKHRPAQLMRQDGQGLGFAVCTGHLGQMGLP
jgi:hypothetical protein